MAKTRRSGRIKKDLLDFNSPSRPLRSTSRKQRKVTAQLSRFQDDPDPEEEEVDDFSDDEESVGVKSGDSFVVGDNVIIMDTDSAEESDDEDDILNQVKGPRSSSEKSSTSKLISNPGCSSHASRSRSRLRSSSTNASPGKKKKRKTVECDDDQFEEEEEVDLSVGDDVRGSKKVKCLNPSCKKKVWTEKEFCPRCSLWEHAFYMSTNDCRRDGDMRCFYCEQIRNLRGCRSLRYQNQEELAPIVIRKGDCAKDFPHPDQSKWKFYWNKFMKTSGDGRRDVKLGDCVRREDRRMKDRRRMNVKLGDCVRIKERKGAFSYLVRVNYIIVDGAGETWISGYRIIDLHSKEVRRIPQGDFIVHRDLKRVFPNQQLLTKETSYYSLRSFQVTQLVACVWYREYLHSIHGFCEDSIFPAVFNYDTDTKEIELIEIPDWRVCGYEFIGSNQDQNRKNVAVSTDDIPLYTIQFESRSAVTDDTEVGSSVLSSETRMIESETRVEEIDARMIESGTKIMESGTKIMESGTRTMESGTRMEAIGGSSHRKSSGMSTRRTTRIDTFTSPIRVKEEPSDTNECKREESATEESVPPLMDVAVTREHQQAVDSTRNESNDAPVTVTSKGSNTPFSVTSKGSNTPFSVTSKETIANRLVTGYNVFASEVQESVLESHPGGSFDEISRIIGSEWRELSNELKKEFEEKAQRQNEFPTQERAKEVIGSPSFEEEQNSVHGHRWEQNPVHGHRFEQNPVHECHFEQKCDEDLEWPDEEQEERLAKERQARELLRTCLLTRTSLLLHPDIDLSEPATEIEVSWKLPL